MTEEFKCIKCEKTLEELKKTPDDIPQTHTNFGLKGDKHELCHRCWTNTRRHKREPKKSKEKNRSKDKGKPKYKNRPNANQHQGDAPRKKSKLPQD